MRDEKTELKIYSEDDVDPGFEYKLIPDPMILTILSYAFFMPYSSFLEYPLPFSHLFDSHLLIKAFLRFCLYYKAFLDSFNSTELLCQVQAS